MVAWTLLVLLEQHHSIEEVLSWLSAAMMDALSSGIF